jgi:hypothetical protein
MMLMNNVGCTSVKAGRQETKFAFVEALAERFVPLQDFSRVAMTGGRASRLRMVVASELPS